MQPALEHGWRSKHRALWFFPLANLLHFSNIKMWRHRLGEWDLGECTFPGLAIRMPLCSADILFKNAFGRKIHEPAISRVGGLFVVVIYVWATSGKDERNHSNEPIPHVTHGYAPGIAHTQIYRRRGRQHSPHRQCWKGTLSYRLYLIGLFHMKSLTLHMITRGQHTPPL